MHAQAVCDPHGPSGRIVATIGGPDSPAYGDLEELLAFGTIRINLAFVGPDNYEDVRHLIRRIRARRGDHVGILLDCVGPRVKLGALPKAGVNLVEGKELVVTTREGAVANGDTLPTVFAELPRVVQPGHPVLLAEGRLRLEVVSVDSATDVRCRVVRGGLLKKRGLNLPECDLPVPALSERDERDLGALLGEDIDMIALSFVRGVDDIDMLRAFLAKHGRERLRVMAKIETRQAVEHIDAIAARCDALMVARGDLWAELKNPWALPRVTTQIIAAGRRIGIPVVTATQTLSSMTDRDLPSRAEVDELYFLLHEGTDAIMGSEEFAVGNHPRAVVDAIRAVSREVDTERKESMRSRVLGGALDRERAAVAWAEGTDRIKCLVVISSFGKVVKEVCKYRPHKPLVAITNEHSTARYLQLFPAYGVHVDYRWQDEDHAHIARLALAELGFRGEGTALLVVNHHPAPGRDYSKIEEIPLPAA